MSKEIRQEDISLEASLLNALSIKKNYDQFIKVLEPKKLISITAELLKDYRKYYEKYEKDIDWQLFYPEFCEWHKKDMDADDLKYYRDTVFKLIKESPNENIYVSLLERQATKEIESVLSRGYDHNKLHEILTNLQIEKEAYTNEIDDDVFTLSSVDVSVLETTNGLTWCLRDLQSSLNSHMPGQFVVVAADSDVGKSAFCITQAVHVFKQLHEKESRRPILYCTSEDTKEDLTCRFLANLYQDKCVGGFEEIITKYDIIRKDYATNYNNNLFIGISIRGAADLYRIKRKIDKYNPSLIIIDMLDKLSSSDHINDLTKTYQEFRGIANDGYQIIGTSQAGNTSYQDSETKEYKHRRWLSDKDLAGSKGGGKQGAAYCIISIGKDDVMKNIRYLQTTKKKRGKHVQVTCQLDDIYSCYRELL